MRPRRRLPAAAERPQNLMLIIAKAITVYGVNIWRLAPKYEEEFYRVVPPLLASGELKFSEDVTRGLEHAGEAIEAVQRGTNTGKSVILVAEE